jgi:hypothetical protein
MFIASQQTCNVSGSSASEHASVWLREHCSHTSALVRTFPTSALLFYLFIYLSAYVRMYLFITCARRGKFIIYFIKLTRFETWKHLKCPRSINSGQLASAIDFLLLAFYCHSLEIYNRAPRPRTANWALKIKLPASALSAKLKRANACGF